jgi:hypothetical protein
VDAVSAEVRIGKRHLLTWLEAVQAEGFYGWLRTPEPDTGRLKRAKEGVAQMLLGHLAEQHFESLAAGMLGEKGYRLEDQRVGRTDTDYRLIGPDGRPLFRLNVKFHGTLFSAAQEYVGLEPHHCFALATYKIAAALKKQDEERLPYAFLIISVPEAPRETIERSIRDDWAWLASISDRTTEEAIVRQVATEQWVDSIRFRLRAAEFRVISARRAYALMRAQLFQRVHALRMRAFNRTFRGAEINMHLSLSREMVRYTELLGMLGERGPVAVSVSLDRGEI